MSQRDHCGWGRFPSFKMTTVSRKCRCKKVCPYFHPCCCASWTSLNQVVPWSPGGQKFHPVCPRFPARVRVLPTPFPLRCLPMLCLHVASQQPNRHLLPTLLALYPTPLPILVQGSLYRHPSPIRRLQLCPCHLSWATDHVDCLPNIITQAHPI